jgi:hypothetical protein
MAGSHRIQQALVRPDLAAAVRREMRLVAGTLVIAFVAKHSSGRSARDDSCGR